jgi:hypothetical protein
MMDNSSEIPTSPERPQRTPISLDTGLFERLDKLKEELEALPPEEAALLIDMGIHDVSVESILDILIQRALDNDTGND